MSIPTPHSRSPYFLPSLALFALGLALQLFLSARSWIGGDQILLLNLGWDFAATGHVQPFAKMMTGAGANPGCLLQLLIGVPLKLWPYYQSPLVVIALFDVAAVAILALLFKRALGDRFAFLFLLVYWLSPWRVYHSGFLWEPQYLFLPAALHLWACWKQREAASKLASAVLVASVLFAMQMHNSFVILAILTVILALRHKIRLSVCGCALGLLVGALPLIPTIAAIVNGTLPAARESEGFIGRSLLLVYPVLKGVLYWFRLGSLDVGNPLAQTVFFDGNWVHAHVGGEALRIALRGLQVILVLTIPLSVCASWWFYRPIFKRGESDAAPTGYQAWNAEADWLRSYSFACFVALVISAALSPITLQGWQVIVALHAACVPVIFRLDRLWSKSGSTFYRLLFALLLVQVLLVVVIGLGNNIFRRGPIPEEVYRNSPQLLRILPNDSLRTQ
jgi:hypothetical protein